MSRRAATPLLTTDGELDAFAAFKIACQQLTDRKTDRGEFYVEADLDAFFKEGSHFTRCWDLVATPQQVGIKLSCQVHIKRLADLLQIYHLPSQAKSFFLMLPELSLVYVAAAFKGATAEYAARLDAYYTEFSHCIQDTPLFAFNDLGVIEWHRLSPEQKMWYSFLPTDIWTMMVLVCFRAQFESEVQPFANIPVGGLLQHVFAQHRGDYRGMTVGDFPGVNYDWLGSAEAEGIRSHLQRQFFSKQSALQKPVPIDLSCDLTAAMFEYFAWEGGKYQAGGFPYFFANPLRTLDLAWRITAKIYGDPRLLESPSARARNTALGQLSQDHAFCVSLANIISTEELLVWMTKDEPLGLTGQALFRFKQEFYPLFRQVAALIIKPALDAFEINEQLQDISWQMQYASDVAFDEPNPWMRFVMQDFVYFLMWFSDKQQVALKWIFQRPRSPGFAREAHHGSAGEMLIELFKFFYFPKVARVLFQGQEAFLADHRVELLENLKKVVNQGILGVRTRGGFVGQRPWLADELRAKIFFEGQGVGAGSHYAEISWVLARWRINVLENRDTIAIGSVPQILKISEYSPYVVLDADLKAILDRIADVTQFIRPDSRRVNFYQLDSIIAEFVQLIENKQHLFNRCVYPGLAILDSRPYIYHRQLLIEFLSYLRQPDPLTVWSHEADEQHKDSLIRLVVKISDRILEQINMASHFRVKAWFLNHKSLFWYPAIFSLLGVEVWINNYVLKSYHPVIDFIVWPIVLVLGLVRLSFVMRRHYGAYQLHQHLAATLHRQYPHGSFIVEKPINFGSVLVSGAVALLGGVMCAAAQTIVPKDFHPEMDLRIAASIVGALFILPAFYWFVKHSYQRCTGRSLWRKRPIARTSMKYILFDATILASSVAAVGAANMLIPNNEEALGRFDLFGALMILAILTITYGGAQLIFRLSLLCLYNKSQVQTWRRPAGRSAGISFAEVADRAEQGGRAGAYVGLRD